MTQSHSVSLLISTYNWPRALQLCLESVLRQSVIPDEVIIADDGSKDDTRELIDSFRDKFPVPLIHVWHEDNGFRKTIIMNKAIAEIQHKYVIQIDGDIILTRNFIKDHLNFSKPGFFVCGSRVLTTESLTEKLLSGKMHPQLLSAFTPGVIDKVNTFRFRILRNLLKRRYKKNQPIYARGCNMAFWHADLLAVNGYNEDITGWGVEDSELACRLIQKGIHRHFIKFGAVEYHLHHAFKDKSNESRNYEILGKIIETRQFYAENGVDKYLLINGAE